MSRIFPFPLAAPVMLATLSACASIGSVMSPYAESFSCKNKDHGQCVHPDRAYADAVAGRDPRSDPAVSRSGKPKTDRIKASGPFGAYRDSVYRELKGLIDAPVTPMLKPSRTVRTLILPYSDRQRPDRLYMPRYIFSILERPEWVVGGYLVEPASKAGQAPVLGQTREPAAQAGDPQ